MKYLVSFEGISHNSLRMCLETVLMQPGINPENVIVCFVFDINKKNFLLNFKVAIDEKFTESLALIDLFGFRGENTSSSSTYMGKIKYN